MHGWTRQGRHHKHGCSVHTNPPPTDAMDVEDIGVATVAVCCLLPPPLQSDGRRRDCRLSTPRAGCVCRQDSGLCQRFVSFPQVSSFFFLRVFCFQVAALARKHRPQHLRSEMMKTQELSQGLAAAPAQQYVAPNGAPTARMVNTVPSQAVFTFVQPSMTSCCTNTPAGSSLIVDCPAGTITYNGSVCGASSCSQKYRATAAIQTATIVEVETAVCFPWHFALGVLSACWFLGLVWTFWTFFGYLWAAIAFVVMVYHCGMICNSTLRRVTINGHIHIWLNPPDAQHLQGIVRAVRGAAIRPHLAHVDMFAAIQHETATFPVQLGAAALQVTTVTTTTNVV